MEMMKTSTTSAESEKSETSVAPPTSWRSGLKRFKTWTESLSFNLQLYTLLAVLVLCVNIGWLAWAKVNYAKISGSSRLAEIFFGNCESASRIDTYLHLLINVLSTLLLSGSNMFIATYCSPSREEVDSAHRAGTWVNIGIYSLRNLLHLSKRKVLICVLLTATSIPFSLLYNSLIFTSTTATEYRWAVVRPEFLDGAPFRLHSSESQTVATEYAHYENIQHQASSYDRLDNNTCIETYYQALLSSKRNLLVVKPYANLKNKNPVIRHGYASFGRDATHMSDWMCPRYSYACLPKYMTEFRQRHTILGDKVAYCLSEPIEPLCSVRFSWTIMTITLVCNIFKLLIMGFILSRTRVEKLLVTAGDAMASFLTVEDTTTSDWYLSVEGLKSSPEQRVRRGILPKGCSGDLRKETVSKLHWMAYLLMVCLCAAFAILFLALAVNQISNTRQVSLSSLPFGKLSLNALVFSADSQKAFLTFSIIANSPQLALSTVYLVYQNLLTSLYLADDWHGFSLKSKGLMVQTPSGDQRSSWYFGMPFFPGLFLQAVQIVCHWLFSEAIFPIRVELYNADGKRLQRNSVLHNCGFSWQAILLSLIFTIFLPTVPIGLGYRRLKGNKNQPIVGTCSMLISAACNHSAKFGINRDKMVYQKLFWGKIRDPATDREYSAFFPVGHLGAEATENEDSSDWKDAKHRGIVGKESAKSWIRRLYFKHPDEFPF